MFVIWRKIELVFIAFKYKWMIWWYHVLICAYYDFKMNIRNIEWISIRVFKENKARQIFRKTNISYSLMRTPTPLIPWPEGKKLVF